MTLVSVFRSWQVALAESAANAAEQQWLEDHGQSERTYRPIWMLADGTADADYYFPGARHAAVTGDLFNFATGRSLS